MSKATYNKNEPLNALISIRVSTQLYNKLEQQRAHSDCQTIGEFARSILSNREVTWVHRDATMDGVADELSLIKKEIRSIGTNINQVTRFFNGTTLPSQKIFEALKILDEYKKVTSPCEKVVALISNLKW